MSTPSNPLRQGLGKRILWKNMCILINKQDQVDDCQCSKSTANPNRGPRRTSTVWSHSLDRNHISIRTMPASLSLGIIFISLISYFYCGSRSMLFMSISGSIPRIKPEHAVSFGDANFAFTKVCDHTINRYTWFTSKFKSHNYYQTIWNVSACQKLYHKFCTYCNLLGFISSVF